MRATAIDGLTCVGDVLSGFLFGFKCPATSEIRLDGDDEGLLEGSFWWGIPSTVALKRRGVRSLGSGGI